MFNLPNKINVKSIFYIAYTMAIFYWMFTNVKYISDFRSIIINIVYVLLTFLCIIQAKKYSVKTILLIGISILIIGISWQVSNSNTLIVLLLFIVASKSINFKDLVKYDIKIKIAFLLIIVLLYYLGLTENYFMYRSDGALRSSMGLSHPNTFGVYIFSICCEYIYIRYPNLKIKELILLLIATFVIDYFSDSRGSTYSMIILILGIVFINKKHTKILEKKAIQNIILSLFIIFTILSLWTANEYSKGNEIMYKLNEILSGRIRFSSQFLNDYSAKLFGNSMELLGVKEANETGKQALVLDNAYVKLILQYGILSYLLFGLSVYISFRYAFKNKDYAFCIIFCIYILRGFTGNVLFSLYGNIFLLYISNYLYNKKIVNGESNENKKNMEKDKENIFIQ